MADGQTLSMWADHEAEQDLLGFGHLAEAVAAIVRSNDLLPATIGVFGDWGGGKSTLLKMVARTLENDEGCLVLQFNGWLFEGYDDAKAALMETIIDEVVSRRKLGTDAKRIAVKLLRRVNILRLVGKTIKYGAAAVAGGPVGLGVMAGLDVAEVIKRGAAKLENVEGEALDTLLEDERAATLRRDIREFRGQFSELLDQTSISRLVVVIDDLDRCLPSTVIETLEAIKLFLFADRTAFILGADERLVKYAVRMRFPELPGERAEVGRDYLEKLIQFPVRVPSLSRAETTNYVGHLFVAGCKMEDEKRAELQRRALAGTAGQLGEVFDFLKAAAEVGGCPAHLNENLALAARIGPILAAGLNGNPRQCKRFLNALVLRLRMAAARNVAVEPKVLAKLMLLEYFKPASFRRLAELQAAAANGEPTILHRIEKELRPKPAPSTGEAAAEETDDEPEPSRRAAPKLKKTDPELKATGEEAAHSDGRAAPGSAVATAGEDVDGWLDDPWLRDWASLEPALGGVDLRPYFYFSRDILNPIASAAQRLTPRAQAVLEQLLQASEAVRKIALKSAGDLSDADAAAVFEELTARARREENLGADDSPLKRLTDWTNVRRELAGQLVVVLGQLPEAALPMSVVPALIRVSEGTLAASAAARLVERWEASGNKLLARAAKRQNSAPPRGMR